jgi:hypothetical protein
MRTSVFAVFAVALLLIPAFAWARIAHESPYLACVAAYPVVSLGNAGRFTVDTNVPGPFMWVAGDWGYPDAETVFVTAMTELGTQQVTVVWGSRRASCYVEVVGYPGYGEPVQYGAYGAYTPQGQVPNITLSYVKLSAVPYTGPATPLGVVLAALLLLGYATLVYRYAGKAIIASVR